MNKINRFKRHDLLINLIGIFVILFLIVIISYLFFFGLKNSFNNGITELIIQQTKSQVCLITDGNTIFPVNISEVFNLGGQRSNRLS